MLREGSAGDVDAVRALFSEMEGRVLQAEDFRAIALAALDAPDHLLLVWEEEGTVLGALHLRVERQLHHCAAVAEVMELAVAAEARGRGVGKALLDEAKRRAAERGCVQLELACNVLRTDAHRFYEREGLRPSHRKYTLPLTGEDDALPRLGR